MARMAVIMYRCDGCSTTCEPEAIDPRYPNASNRFGRDLLPPSWSSIMSSNNMRNETKMHFCDVCTAEASRLLTGMCLGSKDVSDLGVKPMIDPATEKEEG